MASKKVSISAMEYFRFNGAYGLAQQEILFLIRYMNRIMLESKSDFVGDNLEKFIDEINEKISIIYNVIDSITEFNSFNGDDIPVYVKVSKSDLQELIKAIDSLNIFLNSEIDKILEEVYADVWKSAIKYANETKSGINKRKSFITMLLANMKQIIIDESQKISFKLEN